MLLNIAAAYWPDADEVVITFDSTEDDAETVTIADRLVLNLLVETKDLIGTKTLRPLSTVTVTPEYVSPNKTYSVRFRAPERRMDLHLEAQATFGSDPVVTKRVRVGISDSPRTHIDLPGNDIWEIDVLEQIRDMGGDDDINNTNRVVLAPEIQNYVREFDFSNNAPVETFDTLEYTGGGAERLLLNQQTNSFVAQNLAEPWSIPAYFFAEPAATNLVVNSFFLQAANGIPTGWVMDAAGAVTTSDVNFDYQTSDAAKIWTARFRQQNHFNGFDKVSFRITDIPVADVGLTHTFSTYLRMRRMSPATIVNTCRIRIEWVDAGTVLSAVSRDYNTSDVQSLTLVSVSGALPVAATTANLIVEFFNVDAGDDIEVSLFAPQLEVFAFPTSRILTSRAQDQLTTGAYDPANQKIRFQMIAGFDSTLPPTGAFVSGPLEVLFLANQLQATVDTHQLSVPVTFAMGDFLDLTVSHRQNGKLEIYRDGTLLGDLTLPAISAPPAPLTINGIAAELLKLSIFGRV